MNNGTHTLAVHPVGGSSETLNNNNTVHEGPEHNPGLASSEQPQSTELANPEKKKPSKKLWSLKRSDESIPSGGEIFEYKNMGYTFRLELGRITQKLSIAKA